MKERRQRKGMGKKQGVPNPQDICLGKLKKKDIIKTPFLSEGLHQSKQKCGPKLFRFKKGN